MTKLFASGHRCCAGCGAALAARFLLEATGPNVIVCEPTGCMEVTTTPYPQSAWGVPWIHNLFENAASVASGVEAALKAMGKNDTKVVCFGGDGSTFDIGVGCLSGMFERGHDILYVCYDNEAYMNTGIQRSGATPFRAHTTTSPAGKESLGNDRPKKNMPAIAAAHGIPYVATATIAYPRDYKKKVKKALDIEGPKYIQVLTPCVPGWGYDGAHTIEIARLAAETAIYPLYEMENGEVTGVKKTKERKPVEEYLKTQVRFRHLFKMPGGEEEIKKIQQFADLNAEFYGLEG